MSLPFEGIAELDRIVHEPARLAILTALSACRSADFLYLQRLTGLTKGNLSAHLSKLEGAELILIDKEFVAKVPHTRLSLTRTGRAAIVRHWAKLEKLRRESLEWAPGDFAKGGSSA
jgi:DNA-binding transcriptional ArsR family regulator